MSITTRSPRNFSLILEGTPSNIGPGSYEVPALISTPDPSPYPFNSTTLRMKEIEEERPGPADYHPVVPKLNLYTNGVSMRSSSPRTSFILPETPSPAEYSSISEWKKLKSSQREPMSSRSPRNFRKDDNSIQCGPADHDIRFPMKKGHVIPKSARNNPKNFSSPGPGYYNSTELKPQTPNNPSPQFLSSESRDIFRIPKWASTSQDVGLEEWSIKSKNMAPFGSNARRKHFWSSSKTPSPCQYNAQTKKPVAPSVAAFGVGSERELYKYSDSPGPADYKVEHKRKFKDDQNRPFLQRSARFQSKPPEYTAEVGKYDITKSIEINREKKLSILSPAFKYNGDREVYKVDNTIPGVGYYYPEKSPRNHKLKICIDGTERAKPNSFAGVVIQQTPSPADYTQNPVHVAFKSDTRVHIRNSKRMEFGLNTCSPSPDSYKVSGSMLKPTYNITYSLGNF